MGTDRKGILKNRIIAFLEELINALLHEIGNIEFNKYNPQQLYLMCLYGRILELAVTIKNLMKANDYAGLPILLRTQMEAFVDFANLIKDEDFIHTIAAAFIDQKNRLYNNLGKHLDPSETQTRELDTVDKIAEGHQPQSIRKRFENVNLEKTYISAYFILCNYAHNNLAMLEHRHLEMNSEGHRVIFFKEEPLEMFIKFAMTMGAMLVDAHNNLFSFFNVAPSEPVQAVCSKFSNIREETKELLKTL